MGRYRKKLGVVEAQQWYRPGDHPLVSKPVWSHAGGSYCDMCRQHIDEHGVIDGPKGRKTVCPGDWVVTTSKSEHHPVKPDIFAATYEAVTDA